jgi:hypothetical protein
MQSVEGTFIDGIYICECGFEVEGALAIPVCCDLDAYATFMKEWRPSFRPSDPNEISVRLVVLRKPFGLPIRIATVVTS